jgi:ketopantoate reductase
VCWWLSDTASGFSRWWLDVSRLRQMEVPESRAKTVTWRKQVGIETPFINVLYESGTLGKGGLMNWDRDDS